MAKVLLIEERGEIRRLIERRFSSELVIESVPAIDLASEKFHSAFYDIVVCDADARPWERSKAIRFLEKLSKKFPRTKLFIVADSAEPHIPGIKETPYRWIQRPIQEVELCALIGASSPKKAQVDEADFRDPEVFIANGNPTDAGRERIRSRIRVKSWPLLRLRSMGRVSRSARKRSSSERDQLRSLV